MIVNQFNEQLKDMDDSRQNCDHVGKTSRHHGDRVRPSGRNLHRIPLHRSGTIRFRTIEVVAVEGRQPDEV